MTDALVMTASAEDKQHRLALLAVASIALLGGLAVNFGMNWGPWAGSDSVLYIEGARNLADGAGLTTLQASGDRVPISLHPPLYPISLSLLHRLEIDLVAGARIANVALFALFITLVGFLILQISQQSLIALAAVSLLATSPAMLGNFTGLMTESLFLLLSIPALLLAVLYVLRGRPLLLVASCLMCSLAFLTRFAGLPVALSATLLLLWLGQGEARRRILISGAYLGVVMLPTAIWAILVKQAGGTPGLISLQYQDIWERLAPFRISVVNTIWSWNLFDYVLPSAGYRLKLVAMATLAALMILLLTVLVVRRDRKGGYPDTFTGNLLTAVAFGSFSLAYLGFLGAAFLFSAQRAEPPDERILSPLQIGVSIWILAMFSILSGSLGRKHAWWALGTALLLFQLTYQINESKDYINGLHENGRGFTGRRWRSSGLINAVSDLPSDQQLISNEPDAIMLYTNRPAFGIPEIQDETEYAPYLTFGDDYENDGVQRRFRDEGAALVLFASAFWQFYPIYEN